MALSSTNQSSSASSATFFTEIYQMSTVLSIGVQEHVGGTAINVDSKIQ